MADKEGTKFEGEVKVKVGSKSYKAKAVVVKPEGEERTEVQVSIGGLGVCVTLPKGEEIAKMIEEGSQRVAVKGIKKIRNGLNGILKIIDEPAPQPSQQVPPKAPAEQAKEEDK